MQAALESDSLSEQQLFDYGTNFVRADMATVQGAQLPWPYGGKQRQIMVDVDPPRLWAWGLSPRDVTAAIATQNVILPTDLFVVPFESTKAVRSYANLYKLLLKHHGEEHRVLHVLRGHGARYDAQSS